MTIDEFLDKNESFKNILDLPRVAELIDVTREIERAAWDIRTQESALLETLEQYRREAANPRNWAMYVYKGLVEEEKNRLKRIDEIIERKVGIRTIGLQRRLVKALAEVQKLKREKCAATS